MIFAIAGGIFFWQALTRPYRGFEGEAAQVEVRRGWNSAEILKHLQEAGILRDDFVPLVYLKLVRRGDSLKAGIYRFTGTNAPVDVIEKLVEGEVVLRSVTVREGIDRFAIARIFAAEGFGSVESWEKETSNPELIEDLAPKASSLEGYLFPDTYKLAPGTPVRTIVETMVANFRAQFGDEIAFISTPLDVHETVTLASIVETEARLEAERPLIASVYLNRVERKMLLGADPTVIYALKLEDRWDGNIRKEDLRLDSPYNTYRYRGLPPGPIANPGLASLRAASDPADSDYLYFVSRNDGSHVFARSLAEHNRNVNEYQRRFWRRKAQAERR